MAHGFIPVVQSTCLARLDRFRSNTMTTGRSLYELTSYDSTGCVLDAAISKQSL